MQFEDIYRLEVVEALEHDHDLDFKDIGTTYFQKGVCPGCGERTLYIARKQPYQLKCNRLNQCQFEEKTRERYSHLFENLSERFPRTELKARGLGGLVFYIRNRLSGLPWDSQRFTYRRQHGVGLGSAPFLFH